MSKRDPWVVAVDGGGTRCRIACQWDGQVVSVETGAANVSTDFDGGIAAVLDGVEALRAKTGHDLTACPAFVGLAGVISPQIARRVADALPFRQARVEEDRLAAVRGALGEGDGALAHCGTGSFFAMQRAGNAVFVGGWGPVLGDEASAQWVGRTALAATLASVDGLRAASDLTAGFLARLGGAPGVVAYAGDADGEAFGALAPAVTSAAEAGDPVALDVMGRAAADIARALRHLGWTPGMALCLTGGIGPVYAPYLPADMRAAVAAPKGTPLEGALALASDFARGVAP